MATRPLAGVLLLLLLHTSYPAPAHAQATPSSRFPGAQWEVRTPEEVGMSNQRLEEALEYARGPTNTRSHCVSVHRRGFLVAEGYWNGRDPSSTDIVWSTAKAVAATLVGIAEQDGLLSTESLASAHIPEWQDTPSEGITVDMLLRHDSGRYYDLISDFVVPQLTGLNGSGLPPTQTDYAVRQEGCLLGPCQAHPPGTVYQYNQMAFQALEPVLRLATGLSLNELSRTRLHSALGFESEAFWDEVGAFTRVLCPILFPGLCGPAGIENGPLVYGSLNLSCRDLARFGHLWLHRGEWGEPDGGGRFSVFSPDFFAKATNPPQRGGRNYHWSRNGDTLTATGMGGQFVAFDEVDDLVITRIGEAASPAGLGEFSPGTLINLVRSALLDDDDDDDGARRSASRWNLTAALAAEAAGDADAEVLSWLTKQQAAGELSGTVSNALSSQSGLGGLAHDTQRDQPAK